MEIKIPQILKRGRKRMEKFEKKYGKYDSFIMITKGKRYEIEEEGEEEHEEEEEEAEKEPPKKGRSTRRKSTKTSTLIFIANKPRKSRRKLKL